MYSWPNVDRTDDAKKHGNQTGSIRRWSMDGMNTSRDSRSQNRDRPQRSDFEDEFKRRHGSLAVDAALESSSLQAEARSSKLQGRRSQALDSANSDIRTAVHDSNLSARDPIRQDPNSPLVLDGGDWSFLHSFLQNGSNATLPSPMSPLVRSESRSGGTSRDSDMSSSLAQTRARGSWQSMEEYDVQPYRPITPATIRPGSSALDTIVEGASLDHDVSLAETSVFGFDRYRFSSASMRSEPSGTSPRSSPVPATHPEVPTGGTSRASSVLSEASSTGGFRPKPLILRRSSRSADPVSPIARSSFQLSRSSSVPMLSLPSPVEKQGSPRSEMAGPSSLGKEYLVSSPTIDTELAREDREEAVSEACVASRRDQKTNDPQERHEHPDHARHYKLSDSPESSNIMARKPTPATIGVSSPLKIASVAADNEASVDTPSTQHRSLSLSASRTAAITTPRKSYSSTQTDPDQSLRSDSLSPPRSAASGETRSSGTIELVPWQVTSTDSADPRRSEEIFRPLSMAVTMSRNGHGSSRDTITPRSLARSATMEISSRRFSAQMPHTPLKGGTDFIFGRPEYGGSYMVETSAQAAIAGSERIKGLGFSVPRPNVGPQLSTKPYPNFASSQVVTPWEHEESVLPNPAPDSQSDLARDNRISSPPGAMERLLHELEPVSNDSNLTRTGQQSTSNGGPGDSEQAVASGAAAQHQRSATLNSISILPRTSSMRRRNQSVDIDGRRHDVLSRASAARDRLEAVTEHPQGQDVTSDPSQHPRRPSTVDGDTRLDIGRSGTSDAISGKEPMARMKKRATRHVRLSLALGLFAVLYQALFFTFEAPYLWVSISPALPLVAAGLFLVLDTLMLQIHTFPGERSKLVVFSIVLLASTMAYCCAMSVIKIVTLTRTPDAGTSSPGIHFHRGRNQTDSAFQQVLRDMPMSAVLFALGMIGLLVNVVFIITYAVSAVRGRRRSVSR